MVRVQSEGGNFVEATKKRGRRNQKQNVEVQIELSSKNDQKAECNLEEKNSEIEIFNLKEEEESFKPVRRGRKSQPDLVPKQTRKRKSAYSLDRYKEEGRETFQEETQLLSNKSIDLSQREAPPFNEEAMSMSDIGNRKNEKRRKLISDKILQTEKQQFREIETNLQTEKQQLKYNEKDVQGLKNQIGIFLVHCVANNN